VQVLSTRAAPCVRRSTSPTHLVGDGADRRLGQHILIAADRWLTRMGHSLRGWRSTQVFNCLAAVVAHPVVTETLTQDIDLSSYGQGRLPTSGSHTLTTLADMGGLIHCITCKFNFGTVAGRRGSTATAGRCLSCVVGAGRRGFVGGVVVTRGVGHSHGISAITPSSDLGGVTEVFASSIALNLDVTATCPIEWSLLGVGSGSHGYWLHRSGHPGRLRPNVRREAESCAPTSFQSQTCSHLTMHRRVQQPAFQTTSKEMPRC
jgi:hypothetical protein